MAMPKNLYVLKIPQFDKYNKNKVIGFKERLVRVCSVSKKQEGKCLVESPDGIGGMETVSQYHLQLAGTDDVKRLQEPKNKKKQRRERDKAVQSEDWFGGETVE